MGAREYLNYIVQEIHTTIVATVDDEGLPVTAAIDMMDADENGLYFLTARGKSFYDRLMKRGFLALTALKGEATMTSAAVSVRGKVRELGYSVKLDTNGTKPAFLKELVRDGLVDYAAVDIKNSKEKYAATCGLSEMDLAPVEESVGFLLENRVPYEFRTTVVDEFHEVSDIKKIGEWIRGAEKYYLQCFVGHEELVGNVPCHAATKEKMEQMLEAVRPYVKEAAIRGM